MIHNVLFISLSVPNGPATQRKKSLSFQKSFQLPAVKNFDDDLPPSLPRCRLPGKVQYYPHTHTPLEHENTSTCGHLDSIYIHLHPTRSWNHLGAVTHPNLSLTDRSSHSVTGFQVQTTARVGFLTGPTHPDVSASSSKRFVARVAAAESTAQLQFNSFWAAP